MQFKPIPEPPADRDPIATLEAVRTALPPAPDPDLDCCARVIAETSVDSRDAAADWLTFLRALELAAAEPDGYRRESVDGALDPATLGATFRRRLVGADAALDAIETATDPVAASAVVDRLDRHGAPSRSAGRRRGDRHAARSADRIERLLAWAAAFELVERRPDGYRSPAP